MLTVNQLQEQMKKASPDQIKTNADETAAWEAELEKLQSLRPVLATRDQLKAKEIPTLEAEIKKKDVTISEASKSVEDVCHSTTFLGAYSQSLSSSTRNSRMQSSPCRKSSHFDKLASLC